MSEANDLGFPTKGSFKRTPFPAIVRQLAEHGATGSLYLLNGQKTKKVVFFDAGTPVFVRSNVLSECLGQQLAREGLITQEQCDQTLEAIRRTGKKQGELLVEMGILSEGNLRYGLETQLRQKLFDIFGWTEGKYQFKPGGRQDFGLRIELGPRGIIVAAILETYDEDRARAALAHHAAQFPRANPGVSADELGLIPEEAYFLSCLDGSRSVSQLLDVGGDYGVPNHAALLYGLIESGSVTLDTVSSPSRPAAEPPRPAGADKPDSHFIPAYEPSSTVTGYEDTPLPGQLPHRDLELPDEDEEMFAGVEDSKVQELPRAPSEAPEVSQELLDAESDSVDETFDDDEIEMVEEDELLLEEVDELADEPAVEEAGSGPLVQPRPLADNLAHLEVDDDLALSTNAALEMGEPEAEDPLTTSVAHGNDADALVGLEDLDDVDLGEQALGLDPDDDLSLDADDDLLDEPEDDPFANHTMEIGDLEEAEMDDLSLAEEDPEMGGAMRYADGEAALNEGQWADAVAAFEDAYAQGFDVAELHANLAYGRYMASNMDPSMGHHAMELLDYAQQMNENLDVVHAYRGTILHAMGDERNARVALQRALELNPYNDLALQVMDAMR